jgi:hypothetical protein
LRKAYPKLPTSPFIPSCHSLLKMAAWGTTISAGGGTQTRLAVPARVFCRHQEHIFRPMQAPQFLPHRPLGGAFWQVGDPPPGVGVRRRWLPPADAERSAALSPCFGSLAEVLSGTLVLATKGFMSIPAHLTRLLPG